MLVFIKLGDYIFNTDVISYIHIIGAGCAVCQKNGETIAIATVSEKDMQVALEILFGI
jgi:hypothetical protein